MRDGKRVGEGHTNAITLLTSRHAGLYESNVIYRLQRKQMLRRPLSEVFTFFADATKLELMAPPHVNFKIASPLPLKMESGAVIDYKIRLFGVPFRWKSLIESFVLNQSFVDRQLKGPFRYWRHSHEFREVPGGTMVFDHLDYEIPLGRLGEIARVFFVHGELEQIFDHRSKVVDKILHAASRKS